jgi:hexosaminidase
MRRLIALFIVLLAAVPAWAQRSSLMPWPQSYEQRSGALAVTGAFTIAWSGYRDARLDRAASRFISDMDHRTGLSHYQPGPNLEIIVAADDPGFLTVEMDESYDLGVTPDGVTLKARGPAGVLRGLATLRQMLVPRESGFEIPAAAIHDTPRFRWRGVMLDPVRHFISAAAIKRQIDMMELVKLNVLHLHLSDNEGFRVESLRFPKLTEIASHGEYYTQAQIREIVTYAADRGIRVIPEIDMPGHTAAILTAYPELSASTFDPADRLARFSLAMNPALPQTYAFIEALVGEMAPLFPDAYFHVGGDEVNGAAWASNPGIAAYMRDHDLADRTALQNHFFERVKTIVERSGKTPMGWEEIAGHPLDDNVLVQAWRSSEAMGHIAAQNNPVILSAGFYLDLLRPGLQHYALDPQDVFATPPTMPNEILGPRPQAALTPQQMPLIWGGEAALWSEVVNEDSLDSRLWPRTALIAERFWSPAAVRDEAGAAARIPAIVEALRLSGLDDYANRQRMAARLSRQDPGAVETLASATGPVRNFGRLSQVYADLRAGRPLRLPELNTLADIAAPDSVEAYRLAALVNRFLSGDKDAAPALRRELTTYRDNHPRFLAAAKGIDALEAAIPVSSDVAAYASLGLEAMTLIEKKQKPKTGWRKRADALLKQQAAWVANSSSIPVSIGGAQQPPAQLLIIIAPAIEKLIAAASGK